MALPFVGPSYTLATRKADVQRTVNMHLVGIETPSKAPFILDSIEGLTTLAALGAEVRGLIETRGRAFAVAGAMLYEISSDWTATSRGTLVSSTGPVDMTYGLSQLVIVDGKNGYVLALASNTFAQITAAGFYGSTRVGFVDNYFVYTRPSSQQYELSAIDNASSVDALDFASAESQPDNIVCHLVVGDEIMLLGELTTEFHFNSGNADFPFQRNRGRGFQIGCAAAHSAQTIDNGAFWLGNDKNGTGIVYRLFEGKAQRISTQAVEQALQASTDISQARAYCYQRGGLTYYCVNAPGVKSTWCYEVSTGAWHERCDRDADGQFKALRATCHMHAFGAHVVGDADGRLYKMDAAVYQLAGDPLVRERISPHEAVPGRMRQFFTPFYLDATTGEAPQGVDPQVELSWSKDSGATWSNAAIRSLGRVGERFARLLWTRLGASRDRVWRVRFSGNAPFSIVDAGADAEQGTS
jgi:hypothetical protein